MTFPWWVSGASRTLQPHFWALTGSSFMFCTQVLLLEAHGTPPLWRLALCYMKSGIHLPKDQRMKQAGLGQAAVGRATIIVPVHRIRAIVVSKPVYHHPWKEATAGPASLS